MAEPQPVALHPLVHCAYPAYQSGQESQALRQKDLLVR